MTRRRLARVFLTLAGLTSFGAHPAAAQAVEYYHLDATGSVRAVTDGSGTLVRRHDYLPFGEEPSPQAGADTRRFANKERDAETQMDYFGARYYFAPAGRFTTVDPVMTVTENLFDPQQWNRYAYSKNNPLRFADPDGRVTLEQDQEKGSAAGTAAMGAAVAAGATLTNDGLARADYTRQARELTGPGASEARRALRQETFERLSPFGKAFTEYVKESRVGQLDGKTAAQLAESASRTSPGINAIGGAARIAGPSLLVVGAAGSAYNISTAPPGSRGRVAASEVGAWSGATAGGLAGAKLGAVIGTAFGPGPGTAIGAAVGTVSGGVVGAVAGSRMGTAIYDRLFR